MEGWVRDILTLVLVVLFALLEHVIRWAARRKATRRPRRAETTRRDTSGEELRFEQDLAAVGKHLEALTRLWDEQRRTVASRLGRWIATFLDGRLSEVSAEFAELRTRRGADRLRGRLEDLERTLDFLVELAHEREAEALRDLVWADRVLAELSGQVAEVHFLASRRRSGRLDLGEPLVVVAVPEGWSGDLRMWPETTVRLLVAVSRELFLGPLRDLAGLPARWPVSYIEPVYLGTEEVLGPFGGWLETLVADLLGVLKLGPVWYRVLASQAPGAVWVVETDPAGMHLSGRAPLGIRLAFVRAALVSLGVEGLESTDWGTDAVVAFPTRRGTRYHVTADVFVEAAEKLAEFFLQEPLPLLDGVGLSSLADRATWEEAEYVARHRGAGRAPALARLGAGLALWAEDPEGCSPELARRLLAEQESRARRRIAERAAGAGLARLVLESMILAQVLQGRQRRSRTPWHAGSSPSGWASWS